MDVTTLFESYEADQARKLQHKRAFQNYKEFEFLKVGISKKKEDKKKSSDVFDPFNYPGLEDSVASVFTEGSGQLKVNDAGEKPWQIQHGRRFEPISESEFLETYLGRDYMRHPLLSSKEENLVFGYQDSLKEQFSDRNEFLKYP